MGVRPSAGTTEGAGCDEGSLLSITERMLLIMSPIIWLISSLVTGWEDPDGIDVFCGG